MLQDQRKAFLGTSGGPPETERTATAKNESSKAGSSIRSRPYKRGILASIGEDSLAKMKGRCNLQDSEQVIFRVVGDPKPKGSWSFGKGGRCRNACKGAAKWERRVNHAVIPQVPIWDCPVVVEIAFLFERLQAHRKGQVDVVKATSPDIDKLARCVCDCLTGRIYVDDSRIAKLIVTKMFCRPGQEPGCYLRVSKIDWDNKYDRMYVTHVAADIAFDKAVLEGKIDPEDFPEGLDPQTIA